MKFSFIFVYFLSALRKIDKTIITFATFVLTSVRMEQLCFQCTDLHEIWHLSVFRNSVENVEVSLKLDKNNGYFTRRPMHIYDNISLNSCQNEKYVR
jgi:hypothetical protein